MIRDSKELQLGKAGEYMVCTDLILKGFVAFPSEQGLPYDVLLDTGEKLLRIQVKTTEKPRIVLQRANPIPAYIFNVKRAGKNGKIRYNKDEIDLFALVSIDTMSIGYVLNKDMPDTLNIRVDSERGNYYDEKGIQDYNKVKELLAEGKNQTEISNILNLNISTVCRYSKKDWIPYKSGARYFSDFIKDKNWFYGI